MSDKCISCRVVPVPAHGDLCEECDRYRDELAQRHEEREEWERQQMDEHFRRYPHG